MVVNCFFVIVIGLVLRGLTVHKNVLTKSEKLTTSPIICKVSYWLKPPCPCGHSIYFEKSEVFCTKKCGRPHL